MTATFNAVHKDAGVISTEQKRSLPGNISGEAFIFSFLCYNKVSKS